MEGKNISFACSIMLQILFVSVVLLVFFITTSIGSTGVMDNVTTWEGDFSKEKSIFRDAALIGIQVTDGKTSGEMSIASVSDSSNADDSISVSIYDDGTNGDQIGKDGIRTTRTRMTHGSSTISVVSGNGI